MVAWYASEAAVVLEIAPMVVITISVLLIITLLFGLPAPYGRYQDNNFGFIVPARIAWVLQETPSLAAVIWFWFGEASHKTLPQIFVLSIFCTHYVYRSWIYPFLVRTKNGFPLATFLLAFVWCLYNGYIMGRYLGEFGAITTPQDLTSPRFLIGLALWAIGLGINIHSDHVLRNLRKPGETDYKIPHGGAFEFVSGANYFGEIVEWIGFAILAGGLPALSFALFTASNIGPRAVAHHKWYLQKFGDKYPKNRMAIIPFVY